MITVYNIQKLFQDIAKNNVFIDSFYSGKAFDFNAVADTTFPCLFFELDSFKIDYVVNTAQSLRPVNFAIELLSLFSESHNPIPDYDKELSKLEQIGQSIIMYLTTYLIPTVKFKLDITNVSAIPLIDTYNDRCIGWRYEFTCLAPFSINTCDNYFNHEFMKNYEFCPDEII
jgi:hypothetical protein